jgi:hypothetical protein
MKNTQNIDKVSLIPISTAYCPLRQFLLNSELLNDIMWKSVSDFTQISQIWKVHVEMNLHCEIKYECH